MSGTTMQMWISLGVLAFFIIGLVLAKWSMGLTGMTCCVLLALFKVVPISQAFNGATNKLLIMLAGLYVVSGAFAKTQLMDKIQGLMLGLQNKKGMTLLLSIFAMTIALGQFLPSAVLVPLMGTFTMALSADTTSDVTPSRLMIPITGISPMCQFVFPIGTGLTNFATFNAYYENFVTSNSQLLTVWEPFLFRIIPCILVVLWSIIGYKILPRKGELVNSDLIQAEKKKEEKDEKGKKAFYTPRQEKIVYIVFVLVMLTLVFSMQLGDLMYIVPGCGALVLAYTKTMTLNQIKEHMCSDVVFLIIGILSLSSALSKTGAGKFLGESILGLMGDNPTPVFFLVVVCVISVIMTSLMSNLATAAVLIPVAAVTAITAGWNPKPYVLSIYTMAFCAILLPSASSATAIGHAFAGYNLKDSLKFTVPFSIIGIVGCVLAYYVCY